MPVAEALTLSVKLVQNGAQPPSNVDDAVIVGEGVTKIVVVAEAEQPPLSPDTE
jgi:hypothetical protein